MSASSQSTVSTYVLRAPGVPSILKNGKASNFISGINNVNLF